MGDDEIVAMGCGTLQNIHRCHHRDGNSGDRGVRIARFERVHRGFVPVTRRLALNRRDHIACRQSGVLRPDRFGVQARHEHRQRNRRGESL